MTTATNPKGDGKSFSMMQIGCVYQRHFPDVLLIDTDPDMDCNSGHVLSANHRPGICVAVQRVLLQITEDWRPLSS
jgi:hypothetical protein